MISFTIRPTIPYLKPFDKEQNGQKRTCASFARFN